MAFQVGIGPVKKGLCLEAVIRVNGRSNGDISPVLFSGQSGALDHALATSSLAPQVAGAIEWHINADEAPVRDYNLDFGRDASLFDGTTPYRASDHDPTLVGLDLVN